MYEVIWQPSTLNDLAAAWINATNRAAITLATNAIDRLLSTSPHSQGESRPYNRRIMFEKPLAVTYFINDEVMRVLIIGVRHY